MLAQIDGRSEVLAGGNEAQTNIAEFERIGEVVSRIMSYAQLLLAADLARLFSDR